MSFFKKILIKLLTLESKLILRKYKPFIIAVTGSVGKTSTKDAIYCVLKDQSKYVRKSEKSFNSEFGLPLTVIGVPNAWRSIAGWLRNIGEGLRFIMTDREYPDCLILEIGADHPGDISKITKWLKPDISVITKVSKTPVHVEFFKSPEQVFEEKAALAVAVKDGGSLILFADDSHVSLLSERVVSRNVKVINYGTVATANIVGHDLSIVYKSDGDARFPVATKFGIDIHGMSKSVTISHVIGETYQYPILAAVAVGLAKGIDPEKIIANLESYEAPHGRMNIIQGINMSTIIDDTYNSSPDATLSALRALKLIETSGSKIAVLGDMMELGKYAAEEHKKIGREAASIAHTLITVGPRSRLTADEAVKAGMDPRKVFSFDSSTDVVKAGLPIVVRGDVVLVKGSQSVRTERIVKALLRDPERAAELLVRQEKEWLDKK
jgi:UDP-N-acetylmuramoyl-tripeptide--D-alanyl-D-alanine ligase